MAKTRKNERGTDVVLDFAEDLGRLLGTAQAKAEGWLNQRKAIADQLTQIRDTANQYLHQLSAEGASLAQRVRARGQGRRAKARVQPDDTGQGTPSAPRRRRARKMSAAQRKAVSERMKKYWAARKKTAAPK